MRWNGPVGVVSKREKKKKDEGRRASKRIIIGRTTTGRRKGVRAREKKKSAEKRGCTENTTVRDVKRKSIESTARVYGTILGKRKKGVTKRLEVRRGKGNLETVKIIAARDAKLRRKTGRNHSKERKSS